MTKHLAITLGDPFSINIEMIHRCIQRASASSSFFAASVKVTLIGSDAQWRQQSAALGQSPSLPNGWHFVDIGAGEWKAPAAQLSELARGSAATRALQFLRQDPSIDVVLTCPIDKHAASAAGFEFPGQTEFFEKLWGGPSVMLLAGDRLRVGLCTNHLPLSAVSSHISGDLIIEKCRLLARTLRDQFGMARPRIAVCGLNPHCGDGGMFGQEDQAIVGPAVLAAARLLGDTADVSGPVPADTAFYEAANGHYDAVLAQYHDQGLGPLKTLHFDSAINLTGGLPKLRVSPDHGPARDHFLRGTASPNSFFMAWDLWFSGRAPTRHS